MASTFSLNSAGIKELASSSGMAAIATQVGAQVAAVAQANSPTKDTQFQVLEVRQEEDGVVVSVGSRWSFAHLIEWGSVNNQPYAPLRKAVSSLGLKFEEA